MYIDLETKKLIRNRGQNIRVEVEEKSFTTNTSIFIKYSPEELKYEFNILPAVFKGRRNEAFYNNTIDRYIEEKNLITVLYKSEPRFSLEELKEKLIEKCGEINFSNYENELIQRNKDDFIGLPVDTISTILEKHKDIFIKKKTEIEAVVDYDELVELKLYDELVELNIIGEK